MTGEVIGVAVVVALVGLIISVIVASSKVATSYGELKGELKANSEQTKLNQKNIGELWSSYRNQVAICGSEKSFSAVSLGKLEERVESLVQATTEIKTFMVEIRNKINIGV